jgi:hypothetical protein
MDFFQGFMAVFGATIGALVVYCIICAIRDALRERSRRRAFQRLAVELGLTYEARDDNLVEHLGLAHALRQGKHSRLVCMLGDPPARYAFNVLSGSYAGFSVRAFDFHCDPVRTSNKYTSQTDIHCISVFMVVQEKPFPPLLIYPRSRWMRLEQMVKLERVELEAAEFAQAFVVRADDRKFAYDVCHPRMMEYLLEHDDLSLEIEGRCVATTFEQRVKPTELPGRLQQLIEIRQLFPEYLYRP